MNDYEIVLFIRMLSSEMVYIIFIELLLMFESDQPVAHNANPDFIGDGTSAWKIYNTGSVI